MNNLVELSIVMPCLNEAETLNSCIQKAIGTIQNYEINAEIIIADNGSTDGSQKIAAQHGAKVIHVKTKGYGAALCGGINAASGKYVIMGDADDSYDFSNIASFIDKLREGYDLVMGCRLPKGGGTIMPGAMPLKHRILGNPVLSFLGRLFFKSPITDFHCGLRGFSKEAFKRMDLHTTGMEFASEMVIKATLFKMKMTEVPITLFKDGRSKPPHLRSWRDGWRHLRFMLMYSPRWLFFTPGILLIYVGLIFFLILMSGPFHICGIGFESNTMLMAGLAILVGNQMITFYLLSKVFAISSGFLPPDKKIEKFINMFSLENGILLGIFLFILGSLFIGSAIYEWALTDFYELDYFIKLKKVNPGIIFVILSGQVIFSSFFTSILTLRRK